MKEDWEINKELKELAEKFANLKCALQPLSQEKVAAWEAKWGVTLPGTYRRFITEITDGVVMPRATLIPLEETMTTARGNNWLPSQLPRDFLQKPFLPEDDFNPDSIPGLDDMTWRWSDDEYSNWWMEHLHGTIVISRHKEERTSFLVVTGKSRGQVWADLTTVGEGYERADWDFLDWVLRNAA